MRGQGRIRARCRYAPIRVEGGEGLLVKLEFLALALLKADRAEGSPKLADLKEAVTRRVELLENLGQVGTRVGIRCRLAGGLFGSIVLDGRRWRLSGGAATLHGGGTRTNRTQIAIRRSGRISVERQSSGGRAADVKSAHAQLTMLASVCELRPPRLCGCRARQFVERNSGTDSGAPLPFWAR